MERSLAFYKSIGFESGFLWETPPTYAVLSVGELASLHLSLMDPEHQGQIAPTVLYLFVHQVEEMYERCQSKKLKINTPIGDRDYQMRDFEVKDPDGHVLVFRKSIDIS